MKITFEASEIFSPISRAFSILTSGAEICVNYIQYDEFNGTVIIPMKRKEVIEQTRKGYLSGWLHPPYVSGKNWIDSKLIIRQVDSTKMDVDDLLVNERNSRFSRSGVGGKAAQHRLQSDSCSAAPRRRGLLEYAIIVVDFYQSRRYR